MWKDLGYVLRAKNRKRIIIALNEPKLPSQLAGELELHISHVSRTLNQLQKVEIVECLTPEEKVGRLYRLTEKGKEIRNRIK